jgi:hypothetical protein
VQSNHTNGATATPLGPVWVHARDPLSLYIPSVDAACVYECGGPTLLAPFLCLARLSLLEYSVTSIKELFVAHDQRQYLTPGRSGVAVSGVVTESC